VPLKAPLPTAWSLPFHPFTGSQISIVMCESGEGVDVATTRQISRETSTVAAVTPVGTGGEKTPAATTCAVVMLTSRAFRAVNPEHDGAAETWTPVGTRRTAVTDVPTAAASGKQTAIATNGILTHALMSQAFYFRPASRSHQWTKAAVRRERRDEPQSGGDGDGSDDGNHTKQNLHRQSPWLRPPLSPDVDQLRRAWWTVGAAFRELEHEPAVAVQGPDCRRASLAAVRIDGVAFDRQLAGVP
jgi:hypothetical protein